MFLIISHSCGKIMVFVLYNLKQCVCSCLKRHTASTKKYCGWVFLDARVALVLYYHPWPFFSISKNAASLAGQSDAEPART